MGASNTEVHSPLVLETGNLKPRGGQRALGEGLLAPGGCRHLWAHGHVTLLSASFLTQGPRCVCVPPLLTKTPTWRALQPSVITSYYYYYF